MHKWAAGLLMMLTLPVAAEPCAAPDPGADILWRDWGNGIANHRYQPAQAAAISRSDVARLSLKWAFAYPSEGRLRAQPVVTEDTVYTAGPAGGLYALDVDSGCIRWERQLEVAVRSPLVLGASEVGERLVFFGDETGVVHAVDAISGESRWSREMDPHPAALITAAPKFHEGRLYVPVSSLEVLDAANPLYGCCTFRGSLAALDASTGELLWQTYTTEPPQPTGRNAVFVRQYGPSGAPVWGSPSLDPERGLVYVGTGENYSSPATGTSDAIIAMDMENGAVRWIRQVTPDDAWNMGCAVPGRVNCPQERGLDLDFGAATVLATTEAGDDVLLAGQKSGVVYALSPDDGQVLWQLRVGRGGALGGVHWGMALNGQRLYVPNSDYDLTFMGIVNADRPPGKKRPAMNAVGIDAGTLLWQTEEPFPCATPADCDNGMSAPPTVIPGVVFAGSVAGLLHAYDADSGEKLWTVDTSGDVETVNARKGSGGSIDSDGPVVAAGQVYIHSGYSGLGEGGNVLLVYSVDGR